MPEMGEPPALSSLDNVGACGTYQALKQRVQILKKEHKSVLKSQQATQEFESVALLQQRQHFEDLVKQLDGEVAQLQQQLRQNTERSAKMRQQHEREKKTMATQMERMAKALEGAGAEAAAVAAATATTHATQVTELQHALQELSAARDDDLRAAHVDKQRCLDDIDGWCTGEIEAVRHQAQQQVHAATTAARDWQLHAEEQQRLHQEAVAAVASGRGVTAQLQAENDELKRRLEEAEAQCTSTSQCFEAEQSRARAEVQQLRSEHQVQVQDLKKLHAQQLSTIDHKLQGIIEKKDTTIAALRMDLQNLHSKFQQLEHMLGAQRVTGQ